MDNQQGDDEMKISDGFWMDKKGYDVRYVAGGDFLSSGKRSADNVSSRAIEDRHRRIGGSENE